MVLLALMAVLGACLGVFMKPRIIAVPAAVALAGGLRALLGLAALPAAGSDPGPAWAEFSAAIVGQSLEGYPVLIGACLAGALIAMALGGFLDRGSPEADPSLPRRSHKGRLLRAPGMVEERPIQKAAEERQKSLLGF